MPREQAFYGDTGVSYAYSGLKLVAGGWLPVLQELRECVEAIEPTGFNAVLANLYVDGHDGVDWHSDDEAGLGKEPVIASLSFGATRRFDFSRKQHSELKASIELTHGSLLIMKATTQEFWKHRVPRQPKVTAPRINLTFRVMQRRA